MDFLNVLDWNWLATIGIGVLLLGLLLVVIVYFSSASWSGKTVKTRGPKSRVSEVFQIKNGFRTMVAGVVLLIISQTTFFLGSVTSIDDQDWTGTWTVSLGENDLFGYQAQHLTLVIDQDGEELQGRLYRSREKIAGYLSKVKVDGNSLTAKYGNNDGRKMEVEFLMFADEDSFVGRYRERSGRKRWYGWISRRLE